jgi:hypothetical protein
MAVVTTNPAELDEITVLMVVSAIDDGLYGLRAMTLLRSQRMRTARSLSVVRV